MIIVCQFFVALFVFVGCNSEYEKTNTYAVFKDSLGNKYKVEGRERLREEYDWRVFETFAKYDLNPEVDYTFTCDLFYTESGKEVVENDFICGIYNLLLVGEDSYESIKYGHDNYREIYTEQVGESITLSGAEPGLYCLLLYVTYTFDDNATADCYFFRVFIGSEK